MSKSRDLSSHADLTISVCGADVREGKTVILIWQKRAHGRQWPALHKPDRVVALPSHQSPVAHTFNKVECGNYSALAFQVANRAELSPIKIAGVATCRAGASSPTHHPLAVLNDISMAQFQLDCTKCIAIQLQPIVQLQPVQRGQEEA